MTQATDFSELCKQARRCCRERDFAQAVELFEQALEIEEQPETHLHLGTAAFMSGDNEKAIQHFTRVTQLQPQNSQARINLGAAYNRTKDYQKAIEALRRGLSLDMRCAPGYFNLGMAHSHLKQPKLAIPALREAIRLDPKMADAYVHLATLYLGQDNYKQAVDSAQKALVIRPKYAAAQQVLDRAEETRDSAKEAAKSLDWIAGVSPTKVDKTFRELDDEERSLDRRQLTVLSHAIRKISDEMLRHMQTELEPSTRLVNRTLSQPKAATVSLVDTFETFKRAVKTYRILRARLGDKMRELQEHEQAMLDRNGAE